VLTEKHSLAEASQPVVAAERPQDGGVQRGDHARFVCRSDALRYANGDDGHPERAMIEEDFDGIMLEMEGA
jgi:hypothetical protein